MVLVTSQVVSSNNISGVITSGNLAIIEVVGNIPETWINFGYISIEINDQSVGNRYPVIYSEKLTNQGMIYAPNHSLNYHVRFYPKPWLLRADPLPLFEVYQV